VRLSKANDTLRWPDDAVERVWQLTRGHPFLTQQLCSHVWERAYDEEPNELPSVTPADVDAAVPDALEASRNTLEWLWDGLPPAERVVASALAEAGPGPITQEELERLLHESGVRVVIRELQNAPQMLQDWDLIGPADSGYRFRVELLRRWIAEHKPLRRVQEELDRIEPVAENLYRAGLGFFRSGQLDQAIDQLRQAIGLNPNHAGANQLLADILLARKQPGEARQLLERLYEYQPAAARSRLVQALLAEAPTAESDDERLVLYERVLHYEPAQPEAAAKVVVIRQEMRRRELTARLQELQVLEQKGRYEDALHLARELADEYSQMRDWTSNLERLERKTHRASLYQRGLGALQSGDRQTARTLLAQVVALDPEDEKAVRDLYQAVTGEDPTKVWHTILKILIERLQELSRFFAGMAQSASRKGKIAFVLIAVVLIVGGVIGGAVLLTVSGGDDPIPQVEDIAFVIDSTNGLTTTIQVGGTFTMTTSEVVNITFELDSTEVETGLSFAWDSASESNRIPEELLDYRFISYRAPNTPDYDAVSLLITHERTGAQVVASFGIVIVEGTLQSSRG
jgi:tetratricopeptide (TPR) repeat protein